MADAVASQTIQDGAKHAVLKFTNISDGTGESAVTKVDVSALSADVNGTTCTGVSIEKIWCQCIGMKVNILFHDYTSFGGLTNNAGSGKTGDIKFTTVGHANGDTYTVILYLRKDY